MNNQKIVELINRKINSLKYDEDIKTIHYHLFEGFKLNIMILEFM